MFISKIERNYLIATLISFILVTIYGVTTTVLGMIRVIQTGDILNNILEICCMIVCFMFLGLAIMFSIEALKRHKGSYIMKTLTVDMNAGKGKLSAKIITATLGLIGLGSAVYFTLVFFGAPLFDLKFPPMLQVNIMTWGYMLFVVGIYFFFYSFIYKKVYSYSY